MVLSGSGQLSFNQIRIELGVPSQAPFSLGDAASGVYAAINTSSPSFPNATNPDSVSEWYSYNHSAGGATCYTVDTAPSTPNTIEWTDYNGVSRTDSGGSSNTIYQLCSQVLPIENPAADVNITSCTTSCTQVHTSLAGATSSPCTC